jgi:hypothetical protein
MTADKCVFRIFNNKEVLLHLRLNKAGRKEAIMVVEIEVMEIVVEAMVETVEEEDKKIK